MEQKRPIPKKRRRRGKRYKRVSLLLVCLFLGGGLCVLLSGGLLLYKKLTPDKASSALNLATMRPLEAEKQQQPVALSVAEAAATPTPAPQVMVTPTAHPLSMGSIRPGESSSLLPAIQQRLMELGYLDFDQPSESYTSLTEEAFRTFQRHHYLEADGIIDESAYDLLMGASAKEYVMQKGDSGENVLSAQQRLYELGFLGKAASSTGSFDTATVTAFSVFQSANGLEETGKGDEKTLLALYGDDSVNNFYKEGDEDPVILSCKQRLTALGYLSGEPDSVLDSLTVQAVKKFQEAMGLIKDGCLGPATVEALSAADAAPYSLFAGNSGLEVLALQKRLCELGYLNEGQLTGYFGGATASAVTAFQKRSGIKNTGTADQKTLKALSSANAKKAKGADADTPMEEETVSETQSGTALFLSIAKSKLGAPYVRGAKGPNSFDCSGFVYWCLKEAGVKQVYMSSLTWRKCGKYQKISTVAELKAGDVLVFSGDTETTGHVGIYIGNGEMIDASSALGQVVQRESVSASYWRSHFLMAFRIWSD